MEPSCGIATEILLDVDSAFSEAGTVLLLIEIDPDRVSVFTISKAPVSTRLPDVLLASTLERDLGLSSSLSYLKCC